MLSASDMMAICVALLPPEEVSERVKTTNASLWERRQAPQHTPMRRAGRCEGFRFDDTHLPHLTLVQQFVQATNLPAVIERTEHVLRRIKPLRLRVSGIGMGSTASYFQIQPTPELQRLHQTLMDALQPLGEPQGKAEAFFSVGEPCREADVEYVRQYGFQASYANYAPHITIAIGPAPEFVEAFDFAARRVALCHLGRFCTCRVLLREWMLPLG